VKQKYITSRCTWISPWASKIAIRRAREAATRLVALLEHGESILDIGTGDGRIADEVASHLSAAIVLVDLVDGRHSQLPLVVGRGEDLPFGDKSFDVTLLVTVLHHTKNPRMLIKEAARVARRTVVVQEDVYGNNIVEDVMVYIIDLVGTIAGGWPRPEKPRKIPEWELMFESAGLRPARKVFHQWTLGYPLLRAKTVIWVLERTR
jgi:ubiquinone/menaquinone biosynthesis C-methylase UbiE